MQQADDALETVQNALEHSDEAIVHPGVRVLLHFGQAVEEIGVTEALTTGP